jgi:hypothetical protein
LISTGSTNPGGGLFNEPEVAALAEIASRILQVMLSGWFSDDDDYVDSLYTVEKFESASRSGAGANVTASYIPYELPTN